MNMSVDLICVFNLMCEHPKLSSSQNSKSTQWRRSEGHCCKGRNRSDLKSNVGSLYFCPDGFSPKQTAPPLPRFKKKKIRKGLNWGQLSAKRGTINSARQVASLSSCPRPATAGYKPQRCYLAATHIVGSEGEESSLLCSDGGEGA